jgi:hypothetical protein
MPDESTPESRPAEPDIKIELKNPIMAALWAWLWPGAGHLYQGRSAKGILYMVCILGTYLFGLGMGNGHVVYASFDRSVEFGFRWHYILQAGVGLPAAPAMVQYYRASKGQQPILGGLMAPPKNLDPNQYDQLALWHDERHMFFELGTLYTVVAGLLNLLAVYDAYAGPVIARPDAEKRGPPEEKE